MVSTSIYLYSLITFLSLSLTAASEDKPCTLRHNGKFYDLNPLSSKTDYELETDQGSKFVLNVCRSIARDSWAPGKDVDQSKVAGTLRREHQDLSIGEYNTTIKWSHTHLQLMFTNGSYCAGKDAKEGVRASTVVEFRCDHSTGHVGTPRILAQLPPDDNESCGFFVEWRTSYACPVYESSMGFFSILFVIIGSVLALYLVVGTLHNRFVLGLAGYDQIPQFSFSSMRYHATEAYQWIRDYASGYQRPAFAGASAYQAAPSTDEETGFRRPFQHGSVNSAINPFSHQSQVSGGDLGGGGGGGGGVGVSQGGFTRASTAGKARAIGTNPVSHQTQVIADANAAAQNQSSPPPGASSPQGLTGQRLQSRRLGEDPKATKEEREFMLGDDDDEDDEFGQDEREEPKKQGDGKGIDSEGIIRL